MYVCMYVCMYNICMYVYMNVLLLCMMCKTLAIGVCSRIRMHYSHTLPPTIAISILIVDTASLIIMIIC